MILSCEHIKKDFGDKEVLKDITFHINEKERAAIVGTNGAGKTTLLRIIVGEDSSDSGNICTSKDTSIGYLPQQLGYHSDKTIYDELLSMKKDVIEKDNELRRLENEISTASGDLLNSLLEKYNKMQTEFENSDGYLYRIQVLSVINGLGFGGEKMHQIINNLSGGQKTRVALGKLLLTTPDLLILDEPTNHLDIASVRWLEEYLSSYPGSVLVVSHDRYFLDKFSDKIIEISNGFSDSYSGNYTDYAKKSRERKEAALKEYQNAEREIKHQEAVIEKLRQFNREKSIRRAESREKMLARMEPVDKPKDDTTSMHFTLTPDITSGNDVLSVSNLSKSFGENHLFSDVSFEIKRGEKIAIIGDNGTGKTTLLKIICDMEPFDEGSITTGTNVETGYYDQEHGILHDEKTVFDEIHDEYPYLNNTEIRNTLAAFDFRGDDVFKKISSLSGGEKGRVSLSKLMLSGANFLLLDEPTNHLDIASREILEDAISGYEGTLLYVSHDRYFIEKTATRILDLTCKKIYDFNGDYSYYLTKKETVEGNAGQKKTNSSDNPSSDSLSSDGNITSSKEEWQRKKEEETNRRRAKKRFDEVESLIDELETQISEIDEKLASPEIASDYEALEKLTEEREEKSERLSELMDEWESLGEYI